MNINTKLYIAAGVLVALVVIIGAEWSAAKLSRLERDAAEAKLRSDELERAADAREAEAAEYKQKIAYLERQLAEASDLSRKQDEKLEKKTADTRNARADVGRIRRQRPDAVDADELCRRLAAAGHACRE